MEEKDFIKPDLCHEKALEEMKPSLAFSDNCDFFLWIDRHVEVL